MLWDYAAGKFSHAVLLKVCAGILAAVAYHIGRLAQRLHSLYNFAFRDLAKADKMDERTFWKEGRKTDSHLSRNVGRMAANRPLAWRCLEVYCRNGRMVLGDDRFGPGI